MDYNRQTTLNRAKAAVLSRDYVLATRLYKGLLRETPNDDSVLSALGEIDVKNGDDLEALKIYQKVLQINPHNVNALNNIGAIYRRLGEYNKSIDALEKAVIEDETNIQSFYNLGFTYRLMKKYDGALKCFHRVIQENPQDVLAYNHLGSIYAGMGEHDKAIASYQQGLKLDHNHPVLHLNLAKSYEKLGLIEKAEFEFEHTLKSKPGWIDAYNDYSDMQIAENKPKAAEDLIKKALVSNPQSVKLHNKLAGVYSSQGKYNESQKEYAASLNINLNDKEALLGLASSYERGGKNLEALDAMRRLARQDQNDDRMLRQYANVLMSAGKLNAASRVVRRIWNKDPESVDTLNLLGQYYICRGEDSKAQGCFDKIAAKDPSALAQYLDGARRYVQKEDFSKAAEFYRSYLSQNPHDRCAALELENLYNNHSIPREEIQDKAMEANVPPVSSSADTPQSEDISKFDKNLMKSPKISEVSDSNIEPVAQNIPDEGDENIVTDPSLSIENLTKEDENAPDVFDMKNLEDDIQASNSGKYTDDLEKLVSPDDFNQSDDGFFKNSPFGSSTSSSGDNEEDMISPDEFGFEEEDINNGDNRKSRPVQLEDGNAPSRLNDEEPVDSDGNEDGSENSGGIQSVSHSAEQHQESPAEDGFSAEGLSQPDAENMNSEDTSSEDKSYGSPYRNSSPSTADSGNPVSDYEPQEYDEETPAITPDLDYVENASGSALSGEDESEHVSGNGGFSAAQTVSSGEATSEEAVEDAAENIDEEEKISVPEPDMRSDEDVLSADEEADDENIEESEDEMAKELFLKLKSLSDYLPEEKKEDFLQSKNRLQLEYIISRLSGDKGLLAAATALREQLCIEDNYVEQDEGVELLHKVLSYMPELIKSLPDKDLVTSIEGQLSFLGKNL